MKKHMHLEQRGLTWWYIRKIPPALRLFMPGPDTGLALFRRNLRTRDLFQAQLARAEADREFLVSTGRAKKRAAGREGSAAELELMDIAERMAQQVADDPYAGEPGSIAEIVAEEAERIAVAKEPLVGSAVASAFYKRATGRGGTPVDQHFEEWISRSPAAPRTDMKRRKVMSDLLNWSPSLTVEAMDIRVMREAVSGALRKGRSAPTVNASLSVLSTYWSWMIDQQYAKEGSNNWTKVREPVRKKNFDNEPRAFTDKELAQLIAASAQRPLISDFIKIAALTGARLEEIGRLQVRHVNLTEASVFLPGTKTEAAPRTIPLHQGLHSIFSTRIEGKQSDAWLFTELPERDAVSPMGRTSPISKAFTRYRRALGIDDHAEGQRNSRVTFHSIRKWTTHQLVESGASDGVIEDIMGWGRRGSKSRDMLRRYDNDPKVRGAAREAVAAIKLPGTATTDSPPAPPTKAFNYDASPRGPRKKVRGEKA
jgi:integrase